MNMTATIELEFEIGWGDNPKRNGRCANSWPGGFKKGIELTETGTPRRSIQSGSTKWNIVSRALS